MKTTISSLVSIKQLLSRANFKYFCLSFCLVIVTLFISYSLIVLGKTKMKYGQKNAQKQMTHSFLSASLAVPCSTKSKTEHSTSSLKQAEVRHIAFLKTHKTGSSTTQNIFLRFGTSRNLTFLLASVENNECGGYPNCISYYNTLTDKNIWPPPENKTFETMCSHVIYNRQSFQRYLPADTVNIGIVREPILRLASAINFFKLLDKTPLSMYANDPFKHDHVMLNNRLAFEFGFDQKLFPNKINRTLTNTVKNEAAMYMNQLKEDFSLIVVTERYSESIVLMKRMLHWTTKDILYSETGKLEHGKFEENEAIKLKSYLYLDYMLYETAIQELERKIAMEGDGFKDEVKTFRKVNKRVNDYCNGNKTVPLEVKATEWNDAFCVDEEFCFYMRKNEIPFLEEIRSKQYPK